MLRKFGALYGENGKKVPQERVTNWEVVNKPVGVEKKEKKHVEKKELKKKHGVSVINHVKDKINRLKNESIYLHNMFASTERKLIKKDYREHIIYDGKNVWTYLNNKSNLSQITLDYDKKKEEYSFSFPMKNSDINYKSSFKEHEEALKYISFILNNYI